MSPVMFSQRPHSIRLAPSGHPAPGTWRCGEQAHALGHAIHGGAEPRACTQHPRETISGRPDLLGTHFLLGPAVGLGAVDGEPARPRPAPGLSRQPAARARRPHPGCAAGPARGSWPGSPRTGLGPCQPGAGSHRSRPPPLTVQVAAVPPELRGPGLLATGTCFYSVAWDFVASDGGGLPASSRRPAGLPGEAGSPGTWAWLTKPPAVRLTAGPLAASSTQAGLSLTGAPEHVAARCWLATPAPLTRARARRFLSPRSAA